MEVNDRRTKRAQQLEQGRKTLTCPVHVGDEQRRPVAWNAELVAARFECDGVLACRQDDSNPDAAPLQPGGQGEHL